MTYLSESTWIDKEYLHTTDPVVAAAWLVSVPVEGQHPSSVVNFYRIKKIHVNSVTDQWRIPTSAIPEVYGYREGEPWCAPIGDAVEVRDRSWDVLPGLQVLHLNAVIPCAGSAESLQTLYEYVKEDR